MHGPTWGPRLLTSARTTAAIEITELLVELDVAAYLRGAGLTHDGIDRIRRRLAA